MTIQMHKPYAALAFALLAFAHLSLQSASADWKDDTVLFRHRMPRRWCGAQGAI